ncbi:ST14 transmembrane serine protease matriptase a [Nothobranchius furzeri]|uniref:Suppressor of tumorigenicity 14 protein homolog n=3 Tax=Nothobranchius TaxID=28779 RepID=A0A1A8B8M8_NOTFU|nr:ST14 transmembrane serine protease matriptase a [Nothobranchius furzeri]
MDYMESGSRYTPKMDKEFEASVQFLPASDPKKVEKSKGPGRTGAVIGVLIFAAVLALMTGLLIWHFHFRKNDWAKKMYSGSLKITDQTFQNAYEDSNTTEFQALAKQVLVELKSIYSNISPLKKYYVGSTVQAFSEGSVVAYYMSEFRVPVGQEASVDQAMAELQNVFAKRIMPNPALRVKDVTTSVTDARMFSTSYRRNLKFSKHLRPNKVEVIESPGFPNTPYTPNTFIQWQLRADPDHVIQIDFSNIVLEDNCNNDLLKIYDSLVPMESRVMEELCGCHAPSKPLKLMSSQNVMLVTMFTNEELNFPGFRAQLSQIPRASAKSCGGKLLGTQGSFQSPNFPNYYLPETDCTWEIQVPVGKVVKVTFQLLLLAEPGQEDGKNCKKDYVMINNKKLCGEYNNGALTETSRTNTMTVMLHSDSSYVDRGFQADYEAVDSSDPCPDMFQCKNLNCIKLNLKCDGWNDCGDLSDELNCKCDSNSITCKNGLCKSMFWKCDGVNDCGDNTDEEGCGCKAGQFACENSKCVSEKNKCDGKDDCGDGSDELGCTKNTDVTCTSLTYKCNNNKCISKVNPECDGTPDCEDNSDEENCDCGKKRFSRNRIVGGQDAEDGEFPWQVSLHAKPYTHVCGASIISPTWLVTAAHCVQDEGSLRLSQASAWDAYLGLHTQDKINSPTVVKRKLKQIIPHPYYNTYTFDNDIALMELDSPVTYTDYIKPICLPAPQHDFKTGNGVWISGWGATREGGSAATVLQKAEVRIINSTVCNTLMKGQLTSQMMCAGVLAGGIDACQGDSGGPLSSPESDRMFLAGVVSWGDGCARRDKPGIYTRVTKFRGWIKEKTKV